ncbi:MAG TPA: 4-aminobutyrate--2-oxoglutarate transaminase [Vicinamibacteria bacterium]|nr:4-aminobutyrate--2-oxoglutarate transaminase [Vicinamibacteria bacterium]
MTAIHLQTEVPGPRSRELFARRQAAVPRGPFHVTPIFAAEAKGSVLVDVDGNRYLDFAGGIGCLNVGHANDAVVKAASAQLQRFTHTSFNVVAYESYVALAERLNRLTPGSFAKKTFFVNSGAEAVENAVKIARVATGRQAILAFEDGFHGRTLLAMSLTSKVHPYKAGFGPFAPEIYRAPYAYCYRCSYNLQYPGCGVACVDALEDLFKRDVAAEEVAAVIVEPVLGEGGFVVPPGEYLPRLRALTEKHGILLIADEVQTGFGRTGKLFACEHSGVVPDLLVTSKSIAGGLPLAGVTGRAEIMDAPGVGGLGGTYSGNPVALAAAHAVLDAFEGGALLARANAIGALVKSRAESWKARFPLIGDVRGQGAMWALELVKDRATRAPAKEETNAVTQKAYERGLITITAGTYGNVLRTLMPLVITDAELGEGLDVLESALADVNGARS